jgi:hypothetical protein
MQSYIAFNLRNPQGKMARDAFERGYRSARFHHEKDRIRQRWMTVTRAP